jgi:membrane-associated phospholipid phosphatase
VAVKWSTLATDAMLADTAANPPGLSPMEQSRILAMAFLAGHDALNNISRVYLPYRLDGSLYVAEPTATYEVAVCEVLRTLMPDRADAFDEALRTSLTAGGISTVGSEVELGRLSAQTILADRADDGAANAQGPYTPGPNPGDYQPTPPVNMATFVNWGQVRPFVLTSGDQFRAPPPYAVTSDEYAADFNEVKSLGAAVASTRTPEQSEIATFWLESTPLSWQRIAAAWVRDIETYPSLEVSLWPAARFFALLQMAQADAYIACLESKYHYKFWRPITAIRAADSDGNVATAADPAWMPFDAVTPPVPEHPSAHAAAATAGAGVFASLDSQPNGLSYRSSTGSTERYFDEFPIPNATTIAREIGLSRIYVGFHFRHAVDAGWAQGGAVAEWVGSHALQAV